MGFWYEVGKVCSMRIARFMGVRMETGLWVRDSGLSFIGKSEESSDGAGWVAGNGRMRFKAQKAGLALRGDGRMEKEFLGVYGV